MKKLLLLALLFPLTISAQHEFGYHATWYFSYGGFGEFGYKKVSHVGDTIMHGMDWLEFEVTGLKATKTGPNPNDVIVLDSNAVFPTFYLSTRNDSVFRLWNYSNPYLLYDFSASIGDKWQFAPKDTFGGCDSLPVATLTRENFDTIDNQVVKYIDVAFPMDTVNGRYQAMCSSVFYPRIYPIFGPIAHVSFFETTPNTCDGGILDFSYQVLTCFSNDSISINFGNRPCDFVPFISVKEFEPTSFEVYPNPTNGFVNIKADEMVARVEVYSLGGQKLIETTQAENIKLPASSGMYVMAIYFEDGRRAVTKVVRE